MPTKPSSSSFEDNGGGNKEELHEILIGRYAGLDHNKIVHHVEGSLSGEVRSYSLDMIR